ncbi:MAG: hypothetical protein EA374_08540 [Acholeplasmatales bacterium]|nr:MAG: hypothetical protein EA374_08540 [Acholeplasmatales bacterium]
MFKNPWTKEGDLRYFAFFKIVIFILFLARGFSLYLDSTLPLSEISGTLSVVMITLFVIQMAFVNYALFMSIVAIMRVSIIELCTVKHNLFKRIIVFVFSYVEAVFIYGLAPYLKYRVIRI